MLTNDMLRQLASDHGNQLSRQADSERLADDLFAQRPRIRRHHLGLRRRITNPQPAPSQA
jgi:hypothetical protein